MKTSEVSKVPLDKDGNVVWYPDYLKKKEYMYVDNVHFNGWLDFAGHIMRGKQLKYVFTTHDKTKEYEVFPEDLDDKLKHMAGGRIAGTFEYVCHGGYYGIKLIHASI